MANLATGIGLVTKRDKFAFGSLLSKRLAVAVCVVNLTPTHPPLLFCPVKTFLVIPHGTCAESLSLQEDIGGFIPILDCPSITRLGSLEG